MHDFRCNDPDDVIAPVIAERFAYLKKDKKERESMSQIMEEMRKEAALEITRAIARNLIEMGDLSLERIAEATGLSLNEVKMLADNKSA